MDFQYDFKRLTLLCGHYGSGKTNVAVNLAYRLKERYNNVAVADLDIVNPYFRTKDSEEEFAKKGIRLICSEFANSNVDLPAMPDDIYAITDDKSLYSVIDIGGDDRGAYALGRLSAAICAENDYEMLAVINKYRPLTPDAESCVQVLREVEAAARIKFTAIVNNSNLGVQTAPDDVLASVKYADEVSSMMKIPIAFTSAEARLYDDLCGKVKNLFPMILQNKLI